MSAWPSIICTLRRSAPCSTMCVAQLWRNPCGLVEWFAVFTSRQIHCRVSGMPRSERNIRARSCRGTLGRARPLRAELIRSRCGLPSRKYCSKARSAERPSGTIRSLSPLPRTCTRPASSARSLTLSETDLRDPQSARIQQLENGAVAQRCGLGLRMRRRQRCPLQHLRHLRLGQRFGQHLPRLG